MAMNLYCKLPFGQLHRGNTIIIQLATALGRTPSSVSMKLCNLASFDPALKARGVTGLKSASRLDREVWNEFHEDWNAMVDESERLLKNKTILPDSIPDIETDAWSEQKIRRGQDFFRRAVLSSYNHRCCITGNPVSRLLRASHIIPWRDNVAERLNPRNGLCLAATQDAAFDAHLIAFDEDLRLVLSPTLRDACAAETLRDNFLLYEGQPLTLPERFTPDPIHLAEHRERLC